MFKRLIEPDYETYTIEGNLLADTAKMCLEPIIDELIDEGYSTVDIQHILVEEISVMVLDKRWARNTILKGKNENKTITD